MNPMRHIESRKLLQIKVLFHSQIQRCWWWIVCLLFMVSVHSSLRLTKLQFYTNKIFPTSDYPSALITVSVSYAYRRSNNVPQIKTIMMLEMHNWWVLFSSQYWHNYIMHSSVNHLFTRLRYVTCSSDLVQSWRKISRKFLPFFYPDQYPFLWKTALVVYLNRMDVTSEMGNHFLADLYAYHFCRIWFDAIRNNATQVQ